MQGKIVTGSSLCTRLTFYMPKIRLRMSHARRAAGSRCVAAQAQRAESADPPGAGRIEKIFGIWKFYYNLRLTRWRGLAKAAVQIYLTAIAYNFKRTMTFSRPRHKGCPRLARAA